MVDAWDPRLPNQCMEAGFSYEKGDKRTRTQMEIGVKTSRRFMSRAPDICTFTLKLTPNQDMVLDYFYDVTLEEGTRYFWLRDQRRDGLAVMVPGTGKALTAKGKAVVARRTWLCQFGDRPPPSDPDGPYYRRVIQVEIYNV